MPSVEWERDVGHARDVDQLHDADEEGLPLQRHRGANLLRSRACNVHECAEMEER